MATACALISHASREGLMEDRAEAVQVDMVAERAPKPVDWVVISINWLQVLGTAELAQIHQCVRHQFHAIVPLLDAFKT